MHNLCQWALLFCTFSFSFPNCNGEQNKFKSQEIKRYQNKFGNNWCQFLFGLHVPTPARLQELCDPAFCLRNHWKDYDLVRELRETLTAELGLEPVERNSFSDILV